MKLAAALQLSEDVLFPLHSQLILYITDNYKQHVSDVVSELLTAQLECGPMPNAMATLRIC